MPGVPTEMLKWQISSLVALVVVTACSADPDHSADATITTGTTAITTTDEATSVTPTTGASETVSSGDAPTTGGPTTDPTSEATSGTTGDPPPAPAGFTACSLSDALPFTDNFTDPTRIRLTPGGEAVYIGTSEHEVRRFLVDAGEACVLTLDPSFGEGGVLQVDHSDLAADGPDQLLAVYSNSIWGVQRVWPTPLIECQPQTQFFGVSVALDGSQRLAVGYDDLLHFAVDGGACMYTPGATVPADLTMMGGLIDPSGQIHLGVWGELGPEPGNEFSMLRLGPGGEDLGLYGNLDPFAADGFCNISELTACGDDLCVHDFNCWGIKRFTTAGVFVKQTVTDPLRDIDFVETSIAGNGDGSRVYVAGVYDGGAAGRAVFRAAL